MTLGIEGVDQRCDRAADQPCRPLHERKGERVPVVCCDGDELGTQFGARPDPVYEQTLGSVIYRLLRVSHDRPAAGDSFEAPRLAASADNVLLDDARVADIPRRAAGASVDPPFREQSGAKPGADLAVDQIDRRLMTRALADREEVHVLVDPGRRVELLLEPSADVVPVPPRHHRRGHRPPGLEPHRPRYTDRDRPQRRIVDLPSTSATISKAAASVSSGPRAMSHSRCTCASTSPSSAATPTWMCSAPKAQVTSKPRSDRNLRRRGARPAAVEMPSSSSSSPS